MSSQPILPADPALRLLAAADQGRPAWQIDEAASGLVVPRSYRGHPGFEAACHRFAAEGWPVQVRLSGGGLVPQSAGVINLHVAYPVVTDDPLCQAEHHYRLLCRLLAEALAELGIDAAPAPVAGSFCDGRFNLAVNGRKIAGTAQYWRRNRQAHAPAPYSVLSHAVLLADAPLEVLNQAANRFEQAIGSPQRYRRDCLTSAAECCGQITTPALLAALQRHTAQLMD